MKWWLANFSKGAPAHSVNEYVIEKHLIVSELAPLLLSQITSVRIEALLQGKAADELGPQSLNHIRGFLSRAFNSARKVGRYTGPNPCVGVAKRRVPRGLPEYLRATEVPRVMAMLTARWRPLFATAIYAGLRKGELLSLRKSDVDLEARLLTVARSGSRETTKGGHADAIPIAVELVPYLEAAIKASPSELMFPSEDEEGSRMRSDVKLASVLRRALGRAHIVTGWKHVCRRRGCKHSEKAPDDDIRRCPVHDAKLWPKPQFDRFGFMTFGTPPHRC